MFNAFLEPCYPRGIDTNGNRVVAAVALEARYRWHRRKSQIIQSGAAGGAAILCPRFVGSLTVATQESRRTAMAIYQQRRSQEPRTSGDSLTCGILRPKISGRDRPDHLALPHRREAGRRWDGCGL